MSLILLFGVDFIRCILYKASFEDCEFGPRAVVALLLLQARRSDRRSSTMQRVRLQLSRCMHPHMASRGFLTRTSRCCRFLLVCLDVEVTKKSKKNHHPDKAHNSDTSGSGLKSKDFPIMHHDENKLGHLRNCQPWFDGSHKWTNGGVCLLSCSGIVPGVHKAMDSAVKKWWEPCVSL